MYQEPKKWISYWSLVLGQKDHLIIQTKSDKVADSIYDGQPSFYTH